jgi:hypothetical protein
MKRILIYLLLVVSMAVVAQQVIEKAEEKRESSELAQAPEDQAAGQEEGDENEDGLDSSEGDAGLVDGLADNPDPSLPDDAADLDATEVLADVETEFEPEEEISEDYPVPLPSDI